MNSFSQPRHSLVTWALLRLRSGKSRVAWQMKGERFATRRLYFCWILGLALLGSLASRAAETNFDFSKDVRPLLQKHCYQCHGPEKQKSGLRLDIREAALTGGDGYAPVIVPGKSAESPLIRFMRGEEKGMEMPPEKDRVSEQEIEIIAGWIDGGAIWPDGIDDAVMVDKTDHWAFKPLGPHVAPAMIPANGNVIDGFIIGELEKHGLSLSAEADRRTLIRRVTYDVTGLPPDPARVEKFVNDTRPEAYAELVEELLGSPHFGERWARHWLDVVRFAESDGFETNQPRPNAWPYRDYVIRSFNEDKPYDRFLMEQLAGDALGVDEATGFIVGGPWDRVKSPDPVLRANQRADELHDMVGTTGSAFLGLTVGCARCHDHKFDPVSQIDYYAMKAVFAGVEHGERDMLAPGFAENQVKVAEARKEMRELEKALARFQPLARPVRTLLLDDTTPGVFEELEKPKGVEPHATGDARGHKQATG
jgi:cytochrome c553